MLAPRTVTATTVPFILIHGQEGVGKTTLAAKMRNPIFLQCEDGCPAGLTMQSFGHLETYAQVVEAIGWLANEPHGYETVVLDSTDALEGAIWKDVCADQRWASVETPGYGKGYVVVDRWWKDILAGLDFLRKRRGMSVVLIAHSAIERIDDPRTTSYTSYVLRIHRRARGIIQDAMDVIGFLTFDVNVTSEDVGFNKKRTRAAGGSTRWIHWEARPSFVAKNRYGLPEKMMIPLNFNIEDLVSYFPRAVAGNGAAIITQSQSTQLENERPLL